MAGLNPKQRRFVEEYLVDLNATQAAIRAKYSAKNADKIGPELLGKTRIAAAIQSAMDERSRRTELTSDYVLEGIREVAERCMQRAPVMDGRGENRKQVVEDGRHVWTFDATGANKSFELLGKHLKLFTEKTEITNPDGSLRPTVIRIVAPDDRSGTASSS